ATIIIYAGAIVVTFLFVLMLAQQEGRSDADDRSREPLLATLTGFVLLGALLYVLYLSYGTGPNSPATRDLDELLAETRRLHGQARNLDGKGSPDELARLVRESYELLPRYRAALHRSQVRWLDLPDLAAQIDTLTLDWPSTEPSQVQQAKVVKELVPKLDKLEEIGVEARARVEQQLACLQPHGDAPERFS